MPRVWRDLVFGGYGAIQLIKKAESESALGNGCLLKLKAAGFLPGKLTWLFFH